MRRGILASREELSGLREQISRKPFDTIYEALRRRCSLILETNPATEAQWRSLSQQGAWGAALGAARTTQGRIFDLLIAHHVDRNQAFRDRAIEELKGIAGWTTWVDPTSGDLPADLCTAEAALACTVGLDWLWEDLGEADRCRILQAIRHKAVAPYRKGLAQKVFWCDCYHHWNAIVNAGCGLASLALSDEEPAAQEALHKAIPAVQHFLAALGREGGWDEGLGHWGAAMRHLLLFGEACWRLVDDRRIIHARGMDATGLFPVYFTPHGQAASFGDNAVAPLYSSFYLLARHHGLRDLLWWLDTYAFNRPGGPAGTSAQDWSALGLALVLRPGDADTPKAPEMIPLKVFHEIGWAAMADHWPRPNLYVAAKTGDLAANHSQLDMNSIQVQAGGEMLLIDRGSAPASREYFSDRRASFYHAQARAHNTVVVAQREHLMDAQGSIIEAQTGKDYRWIACDAGTACGADVHFIRHLVMLVHPVTQEGRMLVVLDEIETVHPQTVDLFWHTRGEVTMPAGGSAGTIAGRRASLQFGLAATAKASAIVEAPPTPPAPGTAPEQILRFNVPASCKGLLVASVFSREKMSGHVELKRNHSEARLRAGGVDLHFKSLRRHLQLDRIATR